MGGVPGGLALLLFLLLRLELFPEEALGLHLLALIRIAGGVGFEIAPGQAEGGQGEDQRNPQALEAGGLQVHVGGQDPRESPGDAGDGQGGADPEGRVLISFRHNQAPLSGGSFQIGKSSIFFSVAQGGQGQGVADILPAIRREGAEAPQQLRLLGRELEAADL